MAQDGEGWWPTLFGTAHTNNNIVFRSSETKAKMSHESKVTIRCSHSQRWKCTVIR